MKDQRQYQSNFTRQCYCASKTQQSFDARKGLVQFHPSSSPTRRRTPSPALTPTYTTIYAWSAFSVCKPLMLATSTCWTRVYSCHTEEARGIFATKTQDNHIKMARVRETFQWGQDIPSPPFHGLIKRALLFVGDLWKNSSRYVTQKGVLRIHYHYWGIAPAVIAGSVPRATDRKQIRLISRRSIDVAGRFQATPDFKTSSRIYMCLRLA